MNELKRRCTNTCIVCGKKFVSDHELDVICSERCVDKHFEKDIKESNEILNSISECTLSEEELPF